MKRIAIIATLMLAVSFTFDGCKDFDSYMDKPEGMLFIEINNSSPILVGRGKSVKLEATPYPAGYDYGGSFTFTAAPGADAYITLTADGQLSGKALGNATIYVEDAKKQVKRTIPVTVILVPLPGEIQFPNEDIGIALGKQLDLGTIAPEGKELKDVAFAVDPPTVAVIKNGLLSATGVGKANITATCGATTKTIAVTVSGGYDNAAVSALNTALKSIDALLPSSMTPSAISLVPNGPDIKLDAGVVAVPKGSNFLTLYDMPVGADGFTERFSIMFDFSCDDYTAYRTFYQNDLSNSSDGAIFINPSGQIGISNPGYTSGLALEPKRWYRLVMTFDFPGTTSIRYLDGADIWKGGSGASSRYGLNTNGAILIGDNDGEDNLMYVKHIVIWPRVLTATEVASLQTAAPLQ